MNSGKMSISAVARKAGIKKQVLDEHVECGHIDMTQDGMIDEKYVEIILAQKEKYIGLKAYLMTHNEGRYDPTYAKDRDKYREFLEINYYFNAKRTTSKEEIILYDLPEREEFYLLREDIPFLYSKSREFFAEHGLTGKEKVDKLYKASNDSKKKGYLTKFLTTIGKHNYPQSIIDFVEIVLQGSPLNEIEQGEIDIMLENVKIKKTGELLRRFYAFVRMCEPVKYGDIHGVKTEAREIKAYPEETISDLWFMLYNDDFARDNHLIEKAFNDHFFAEMWLFLAIHYVCGWRASDICDNWIYPEFSEDNNPLKINFGSLKDDFLAEKNMDDICEKVAGYIIRKIELTGSSPSKTSSFNPGRLRADAKLEHRIMLGKLSIIGCYLYRTTGDGLMRSNRISSYCNWVKGNEFFGKVYIKVFGRRNIHTRRLNKSFLQGIGLVCISLGESPSVSHMAMQYGRLHKGPTTTCIYTKDYGFSGYKPEDAIFDAFQNGVLGVEKYQALLMASPNVFGKLSKKDQSRMMQKIPISAFELENMGTIMADSEYLKDQFCAADTEKAEVAKKIIKEMYAVGRGKGHAKDKGTFCELRALGCSCNHPIVESCIAMGCDKVILTKDGIPALISVLNAFYEKYKNTGNKKYYYAIADYIKPRFKDIIIEIKKDMTHKERVMIDFLIEGKLDED